MPCASPSSGAGFEREPVAARVGNDLWLWFVVVASLVALLVTYVFGAPEIHWWLSTSATGPRFSRTSVPTPTSPYGSHRRGVVATHGDGAFASAAPCCAQVNLRKRFRDAPHERRQPIRIRHGSLRPGGCNTLSGVDGQVDQFDEAGPPSLWIQTVLYRQTSSEISALVRGLNAAARFARARGAYRSIKLTLGDSSSRPSISPEFEREVAATVLRAASTSFATYSTTRTRVQRQARTRYST